MPEGDLGPAKNLWASRGMVASGHALASQAGLFVLRQGGNAVDAAICAALALSVVMPDMCGLGGDAFALVRMPSGPTEAWTGSGALPWDYDEAALPASSGRYLPLYGEMSLTVPAALDLYLDLHRRHGRIPFGAVLEPARELARDGFLVDPRLELSLREHQERVARDPGAAARFYPENCPLGAGEVLRQPELADTLAAISQNGRDAVYAGALGEALVRRVRSGGGFLSARDLKTDPVRRAEPLGVDFFGHRVLATPLPSAGPILLEALALLASDPIDRDWRRRPALVHRVVEALRLSFYDRRARLGDPDRGEAAALLKDPHLERRRRQIGEGRAAIPFDPAEGLKAGDTSSLVVMDGEGGAVSFIHSLALPFGSGVYVREGGFFLNNRAGRSFNRVPGHPNQAQPGRRPMHTLQTYLVERDGAVWAVGNTPGGDGQPQWNLSVLLDLIAGGRTPAEAVSLPRLTVSPATDVHTLSDPEAVYLESPFGPAVWEDLGRRGHTVRVVGPFEGGGSAQVVVRRGHGFVGASDPRGVGQTAGF